MVKIKSIDTLGSPYRVFHGPGFFCSSTCTKQRRWGSHGGWCIVLTLHFTAPTGQVSRLLHLLTRGRASAAEMCPLPPAFPGGTELHFLEETKC